MVEKQGIYARKKVKIVLILICIIIFIILLSIKHKNKESHETKNEISNTTLTRIKDEDTCKLDTCTPSPCQNCDETAYGSQVKVMIKSIELYENEKDAQDLLSKLNAFIKDDDDLSYEYLFTIERRGV